MSVQNMQPKAAVSVSEMANMVGLGRARFYQLMGSGTFPAPSYDPNTGRPYFSEEQQRACLDVRRRNVGIDGKPALFYARRAKLCSAARRPPRRTESITHPLAHGVHADLLDAVKALGLASATSAQVETSTDELYPHGTEGIEPSQIVRAVFLKLKRRGSASGERPGS